MTPDTLLRNHYDCSLKILQFDLCLFSEIFSFFHVFMSDFASNGRRSAAVLGIWFIKATTEESFSLITTKPHSLQKGIQHTPKNYIKGIFPGLPACSDMSSI